MVIIYAKKSQGLANHVQEIREYGGVFYAEVDGLSALVLHTDLDVV